MNFRLIFQPEAEGQFAALTHSPGLAARLKAVRKCLGFLETNPRHPGLNTHKYVSLAGPRGEEVFEAYAQNLTPGAYRIFWYYGPKPGCITILAITPHP
ncbi:MAG: hypothetical protein Q8T11_16290 [Elusimicrobiota bacterium]|nr:hypothetical protein [Elusimicrobiota bacterium]